MGTSETLSDDNPDSAVYVTSIPMSLLENLAVKGRKAKTVLIAVPINMRAEVCEGQHEAQKPIQR